MSLILELILSNFLILYIACIGCSLGVVVAQNVTMPTLTALAEQLAEDVSVIESRQRKRTADQIAKAQELASDWWEKQNN